MRLALPSLLLLDVLSAQASAVDFQQKVLPIFEQRCLQCHATAAPGPDGKLKKPKGGVVLDSKSGITSSLKGKLVVAKKPDDSRLLEVITLPADHDDRMPPASKGDPLTKEQTDIVRKWIEGGAAFGSWTGKTAEAKADGKSDGDGNTGDANRAGAKPKPGKPTDKPRVDPIVALQAGVKPLPAATLATFATGPFLVASVGDDSPLLSVSCRGNADTIDDRALQALAPIATHIAELDLARTRIGDDGGKLIATMPKLVTLDLRQTPIGNHGTAALAACKELRSLNLFGSKAGDYGIAALATCKHLEQLWVWQTDVSAGAAVRLREAIPGLRVVIAPDLPEPMPEGEGGGGRRR
jgi:hypothetical protein